MPRGEEEPGTERGRLMSEIKDAQEQDRIYQEALERNEREIHTRREKYEKMLRARGMSDERQLKFDRDDTDPLAVAYYEYLDAKYDGEEIEYWKEKNSGLLQSLRNELERLRQSGRIPIDEQLQDIQHEAADEYGVVSDAVELHERIMREREDEQTRAKQSAKILSFDERRVAWEEEARKLEQIEGRSQEEEERLKKLQKDIAHVGRMNVRANEIRRLKELEKQAEAVNEDLRRHEEKLRQVEEEKRKEEETLAVEGKGVEQERARLELLTKQMATDPSEDKQQEIDRITAHLHTVDEASGKRQARVQELRDETDTYRELVGAETAKRAAVVAAVAASKEKIGRMSASRGPSGFEGMEDWGPAGGGGEEEPPDRGAEATGGQRPEQPGTTGRASGRGSREGGFLKDMGRAGKKVAGVGWLGVIGAGALVGVATAPFRFVETVFKRLYKLTMHPGDFFKEIGSKYKEAMADPPKGKGAIKGFLGATKWFLIGDKPHQKEEEGGKKEKK